MCQSQLHMSAAAVYVPEDMDARSRFSDGSPQHRAAHPVIENSSRRAVRDQDIGPCWDDWFRAPADPIEADAIDIDRAVRQEVNRAQQFTHVWLNCEDQVVVPRQQYLLSVRERPQPANVSPQRMQVVPAGEVSGMNQNVPGRYGSRLPVVGV